MANVVLSALVNVIVSLDTVAFLIGLILASNLVAILFVTDVAKLALSPSAAASSFNVSNAAGAPPTKLDICPDTQDSVAYGSPFKVIEPVAVSPYTLIYLSSEASKAAFNLVELIFLKFYSLMFLHCSSFHTQRRRKRKLALSALLDTASCFPAR